MDRNEYRRYRRNRCSHGNPGLMVGFIFFAAGGLLIARQVGAPIPSFLISWQMLLITVGIFIGIRTKFRNPGFIFPIIIGTVFLLRDYFPDAFPTEFLFPAALVAVGLLLMLKPKRSHRWGSGNWDLEKGTTETNAITDPENPDAGPSADFTGKETIHGERINETAVFGNVRKMVISKNFVGGEVSSVFGSAEINLLQADIEKEARLELNAVFGSVRLIVPPHWQLKMETTAVLGGVEDKRPRHAIYSDKILVLEGNAVFGGIQIESH